LVWGKELLADATKVQATADPDSLKPRLKEVIDDHLVELFGQDGHAKELKPPPGDPPPLLHPAAQHTEIEAIKDIEQPGRWTGSEAVSGGNGMGTSVGATWDDQNRSSACSYHRAPGVICRYSIMCDFTSSGERRPHRRFFTRLDRF
jgi:hypothetical protein